MTVPAKNILTLQGHFVTVETFRISTKPVTTEEFYRFVASSGYNYCTFNDALEQFGDSLYDEDRPVQYEYLPITYVTLRDAVAYCDYKGCRLPTELEWLAFAVVEDGVCKTLDDVRRKEQIQKDLGLVLVGSEWTSTKEGNKNIVRGGPRIKQCHAFKLWQEPASRSAQPRDMNHAGLTFRTVWLD